MYEKQESIAGVVLCGNLQNRKFKPKTQTRVGLYKADGLRTKRRMVKNRSHILAKTTKSRLRKAR